MSRKPPEHEHPTIATRIGPTGLTTDGKIYIVCEACGSPDLDFCGHDIDKCQDCGHWRYR